MMKTIDIIRKKLVLPGVVMSLIYFMIQFNVGVEDLSASNPYLWMIVLALSLGFVQYFLSESDFDSLNSHAQSDVDMNTFATYSDMQVIFIKESQKVLIECSESLVKRYDLKDYVLVVSEHYFEAFIHPEDTKHALLKESAFDLKINALKEVTFRIKLPGMSDYIKMFRKGYYELESGPGYLAFDITNTEYMNEQLVKQEQQYHSLMIESQKVMENSKDLIIKLDKHGNIIRASQAALTVYAKRKKDMIGKNILDINRSVGEADHGWFEDILQYHQTSSKSVIKTNRKERHISWNYEAILDEQGEIQYILAIGHEITDYVLINQHLKYEKNHDALTGVLNQQGLFESIREYSEIESMVSFFIDIKGFSRINDYYGHAIGDEILKNVAKELTKLESYGCYISRYSGDEFVVVCINDAAHGKRLNKIQQRLEKLESFHYHDKALSIELKKNIGFARYPEDTDDFSRLISLSSLAMQESAKENRGTMKRYDQTMSEKLKNNVLIASKLREAINAEIITIHFQDVVDVHTDKVAYTEALARWFDEDLGEVNPQTFINIAEQSNLIETLDSYLIQKALEAYPDYIDERALDQTRLSLNLAPSSVTNTQFRSYVIKQAQINNIPRSSIMLEISENTFVNNINLCVKRIEEYKQSGFSIALDDFGKEYSSLGVLESVDFDMIKIDAIFTQNLSQIKNQEIIRMVRKITNLTGKELVVEGVEDETQKNILYEMDCRLQQGFYHHKPQRLKQ